MLNNEKTISISKSTFCAENEEKIFRLFKNEIRQSHGKEFSFSRSGDLFIATKQKGSKKKKLLERFALKNLTNGRPFSEIDAREFLEQNFFPENRRSGYTRSFNCLVVLTCNNAKNGRATLGELLTLPGLSYLKSRNAGIKSYITICQRFREMGFQVDSYNFFNAEETAKKAKNLALLIRDLEK